MDYRHNHEPSCMFEAYRNLYEPCCFLGESHEAIVAEEILSDITTSANISSMEISTLEKEVRTAVPIIAKEGRLQIQNGAAESNSEENAIKIDNDQTEPTTNVNAIQIHQGSTDCNVRRKAVKIHDGPSVGRRRARANAIRSIFVDPNELRACDNVVVECVGVAGLRAELMPLRIRRIDLWKYFENEKASDETVVVAIEATHISPLDVCIRHGMFADDVKTPFVLGSNFVGIVHHGALPEGVRVAGLTKTGSNARYIATTTDAVVKVPKRFDSSEIACVISSYLPALQALHNGRGFDRKCSKDSLQNKKVLLTDGASMVEIQAMVQLAFAAGAASVHVVCDCRHHEYVRMHLKAEPLKWGENEWLPQVMNEMDVVIDYDYTLHRNDIANALAPRGRLVWFVHPQTEHGGLFSDAQGFLDQAAICAIDGGSIYNVYENWEFARQESKEDLKYLFTLLASRKIRPKIDRFIPLDGIRQAHDDLQTGGIMGSIICEPWKET